MKFVFEPSEIPTGVAREEWIDWAWHLRHSMKTEADFTRAGFELTSDERRGFEGGGKVFQIRTTPYYASLASKSLAMDPIRRILMPTAAEIAHTASQEMLDPLGERRNNPAPRIIHRYPDRLLFLVTDTCSVYCRYCTRKHFTGQDEAFVRSADYGRALMYIKSHTGLREVILSALARVIQKHQPVYVMTHFNHPRELTLEAASALRLLADHGTPLFNQLVLLNGVNNHPAVIQALSRRLLYLRVKPYYMFQCDPSEGTDHLRTSVEDSLEIQRELWGRLSGLAMPNLSLDIPDGGGKAAYVPNFEVSHEDRVRLAAEGDLRG